MNSKRYNRTKIKSNCCNVDFKKSSTRNRGSSEKKHSLCKVQVLENLEIIKTIPGGKGLAFYNKKPVFVEQALAGETVDALVNYSNSKGYFAKVQKILKSSTLRIEAKCEYYGECGGCDLQHLEYQDQLNLKENFLIDQFTRIAKYPIEKVEMVGSQPWAYRSRVRFHKSSKGWGFLARGSHNLVEVDHCPVLVKSLEEVLKTDSELNNGEYHYQYGDKGLVASGNEVVQVSILDKKFPIRAGAFFQSNQTILPELVKEVLKNLPDQKSLAVDLFAGIGFFSAYLADHFKEVIAVERDVKCKETARSFLPKNVNYFTDSVEEFLLKNEIEGIDFLVVDPPRTGLSLEVRYFLRDLKLKHLCYVSCEPSTLARDVKDLLEYGYKIEKIKGFDFYPQTSHVETVVSFIRD